MCARGREREQERERKRERERERERDVQSERIKKDKKENIVSSKEVVASGKQREKHCIERNDVE